MKWTGYMEEVNRINRRITEVKLGMAHSLATNVSQHVPQAREAEEEMILSATVLATTQNEMVI
jgi:hypothetical protein